MNDAEKREKVIRGLECCSNERCSECPYHNEKECIDALTPDALALLKEREAVEPKIVQSKDFLWSQWYVCGACEHPVDPGDKFCRECGKKVKWDD